MNLHGQTFLLTGAAADPLLPALASAITEAGGTARLRPLEASTPDAARAWLAAASSDGPLHGLIVRPPWMVYADFLATSPAQWTAAVTHNFEHIVYVLQAAAHHLIAHGRGGRLVTLPSVTGVLPFSGTAAYGTTSAMLYALTRMIAVDLAPHGITANAIGIGWVDSVDFAALPTEIQAHIRAGIPRGQPTTPAEIAALLTFILSPAASGITGAWLAADSGYTLTRSAGRGMFEP